MIVKLRTILHVKILRKRMKRRSAPFLPRKNPTRYFTTYLITFGPQNLITICIEGETASICLLHKLIMFVRMLNSAKVRLVNCKRLDRQTSWCSQKSSCVGVERKRFDFNDIWECFYLPWNIFINSIHLQTK